ncbi:MAG TPA: hypothetical protein DD644_15240 [Halomonas sp.]|nr:hypothetical protein [Halomonas sp.]
MNHYKNRLICFLDVLGFSAMVEKAGIEDIYNKYSEFVDTAKNKVFLESLRTTKGLATILRYLRLFLTQYF